MIALCLNHHQEADGGAYTVEQLRSMKRRPYLAKDDAKKRRTSVNWKRRQLAVIIGGNIYLNTSIILRVEQKKIIWLTTDPAGNQLLNLNLWGEDGTLLFSMRNNDWITHSELEDVECSTQGNSIRLYIPSEQTWLKINFMPQDSERLRRDMNELSAKHSDLWTKPLKAQLRKALVSGAGESYTSAIRKMIVEAPAQLAASTDQRFEEIMERTEGSAMLCKISGKLCYPAATRLTENKLVAGNNSLISGNLFTDCEVAMDIEDGRFVVRT